MINLSNKDLIMLENLLGVNFTIRISKDKMKMEIIESVGDYEEYYEFGVDKANALISSFQQSRSCVRNTYIDLALNK